MKCQKALIKGKAGTQKSEWQTVDNVLAYSARAGLLGLNPEKGQRVFIRISG